MRDTALDIPAGTARYAAQRSREKQTTAQRWIREAQSLTGPEVEAALDQWFHSPAYTPQVDQDLQPGSTARAFTDLVYQTFSGAGLKSARATYREIMGQGCCHPQNPKLKTVYWGAKAGSGWRILNVAGYVELPSGRVFAYTYLNDLSRVDDADVLEAQLKPVTLWIENLLLRLSGKP